VLYLLVYFILFYFIMVCDVFQIESLGSVYHLVHDNVERRSRRSAEDIVSRLLEDSNVCILRRCNIYSIVQVQVQVL